MKVLNSESNGATTRYLHEISGIHSQQTPGESWVFPIMDALGSLRGVVNPTGEVLEGQHYTPYGTPFGHTGTAQTPFGFTGEATDPNGLLNLRARYYVPELGVFPSLDPVEEGNRYGYVGGDVVNRVDPSGMIGERPERWDGCTDQDVICSSLPTNECKACCATKARGVLGREGLARQIYSCMASCPPEPLIYRGPSGYLEGWSRVFASLGMALVVEGAETVFNFKTFQMMRFEFRGTADVDVLLGATGTTYTGFIDGFKDNLDSPDDYTQFIDQYRGLSFSSNVGFSVGLPVPVPLSAATGKATFHNAENTLSGHTIYNSLTFGPTPPILDLGFNGQVTYAPRGTRKSYIHQCKIDESELFYDVLHGGLGDLTVTSMSLPMLLFYRRQAAFDGGEAAHIHNLSC